MHAFAAFIGGVILGGLFGLFVGYVWGVDSEAQRWWDEADRRLEEEALENEGDSDSDSDDS